MNSILITKNGGVYSLPEYRPMILDPEVFKEVLSNACQFSESPKIIEFSKNYFFAYYQHSLFLVRKFEASTKLKGRFIVAPTHDWLLARGTDAGAVIKKLTFSIPADLFIMFQVIPESSGQKRQRIYSFMKAPEGSFVSSLMPNTYADGHVCMGNHRIEKDDSISFLHDYFTRAPFDSTWMIYSEIVRDKVWRWDLKTEEFKGDFSEVTFLEQSFEERGSDASGIGELKQVLNSIRSLENRGIDD